MKSETRRVIRALPVILLLTIGPAAAQTRNTEEAPFTPAVRASLATAAATPCGGLGQRACTIFERFPSCDTNLVEYPGCFDGDACNGSIGHCDHPACGYENDRACTVLERLAACDSGLQQIPGCSGDNCNGSSGTCVRVTACGGEGQRSCTFLERAFKPCDDDLTEITACSGDCYANAPAAPGSVSGGMCTKLDAFFPEPTTNATALTPPDGTVYGYADLHMHMLGHMAHGGGVLAGKPYDYDWTTHTDGGFVNALRPDFGSNLDLVIKGDKNTGEPRPAPNCPSYLPNCGARLFHGDHTLFDDPTGSSVGTNDAAKSNFGAPLFNAWPKWTSTTHQQVYYKWLERAWQGGLRLITQFAVTNEALCRGGQRVLGQDCGDSMQTIDQELDEIYKFQDYVDLKSGGTGQGWFRIVTTPKQAREVIAAGKMAVVLGIEVDNLFGAKFPADQCTAKGEKGDFLTSCSFLDRTSTYTLSDIQAKIDAYYKRGVRHIFPIHNFDNTFGAPATWQDAIEVGNRVAEGHWWATEDCPADPAAQAYGFALGTFTQLLVSTLKFWPATITEVPLRTSSTPTCNIFGLFPLGKAAIKYMMDKGIIVDVDHMSRKAFDETIAIAKEKDKPIVATHVLPFDVHDSSQRHERMRTRSQLEAIRETGGMIAAMLKDDNQDQDFPPVGKKGQKLSTAWGTAVADDCRHSSKSFAQMYQYDVDVMGGPVAFGSDFNGIAGHIGPRFGSDGCGGREDVIAYDRLLERAAQYRSSAKLQYPFTLGGFGTFGQQVTGEKTFDYNVDGMAHVGLVPDFVADLENIGMPANDMDMIFRSAEAYIRVWEKAAGIDPATDGPQGVALSGFGIFGLAPYYSHSALAFYATGAKPAGATLNWEFGDGHTATGPLPFHEYAEPGTYTVTVRLIDPVFGGSIGRSQQVTILQGTDPAEISISAPADANEGDTVTVTFSHSIFWAFKSVSCGSGATSSAVTTFGLLNNFHRVSCTYATPGTTTISVTADTTDVITGYRTSTATRAIAIHNRVPSLSASDTVVPWDQPFRQAVALNDATGAPLTLTVTWGDGPSPETFPATAPASVTIEHRYARPSRPGSPYVVTLAVSDGTATITRTIHVDVIGTAPSVTMTGPTVVGLTKTGHYDFTADDADGGGVLVPPSASCGPNGQITAGPTQTAEYSFAIVCLFTAASDDDPVTAAFTDKDEGRVGATTVHVRIVAPPTVVVPGNFDLEALSANGRPVSFPATGASALDGSLTPTCAPASGSTFPLGTTTVTCTATDSLSQKTTGTFTVTIHDSVPPSVSVPANQTLEATGPAGAALTFSASATDVVDGALTPVCTAASGATFALGATAVTCSATDARGNTGSSNFSVTVRDTTPPAVTVPATQTVEASGPTGAAVTLNVSAVDIVDGALTPVCVPANGSTFPLGTTPVSCSATDAHGNTGSASFSVTVRDATPPSIGAVTPSQKVLWPANKTMIPISLSVIASDAVTAAPVCQIAGVASNEPGANQWQVTAPLAVSLRADRDGSGSGRVYTIAVTCSDAAGNVSAPSTTTVTVPRDLRGR